MHGVSTFITDPDAAEELFCRACTARCEVVRNAYGPTSFGAAVAKRARHHDVFTCPNCNEGWHMQAVRLWSEIESTPSKRLAELMGQDLEDILQEHGYGGAPQGLS